MDPSLEVQYSPHYFPTFFLLPDEGLFDPSEMLREWEDGSFCSHEAMRRKIHSLFCSHNAKLLSRLKNVDVAGCNVGGKGALLPTQQFGASLEWIREHQVTLCS